MHLKQVLNAPEESNIVNAMAMGQIIDMDTVTVGSHIAAVYERRRCIGRVAKAKEV